MTVLKITAISLAALLIGAACLGASLFGPLHVLAAPLLALFGWFYLPPIAVAVTVVWGVYDAFFLTCRHRVCLLLAAGVIGSAGMALLGVRGPEPGWLRGYGTGGFLGGLLSAYLVTVLHPARAHRGTVPHGLPPGGRG